MLGKERAEDFAGFIEKSLADMRAEIDKRVQEVQVQQKVVIKEEVKIELEKDLAKQLASKQDVMDLKVEIAQLKIEMAQLKADAKVKFYILASLIIVLNPAAIDLISKLVGLSK